MRLNLVHLLVLALVIYAGYWIYKNKIKKA
jgi:hypothetical protein